MCTTNNILCSKFVITLVGSVVTTIEVHAKLYVVFSILHCIVKKVHAEYINYLYLFFIPLMH